jgi:hypothetical protein
MAIGSFKLNQLFILLVPDLVVDVGVGNFNFPAEPDFVKEFLSVWLQFVVVMTVTLTPNPEPKRLVILVLGWYLAMALLSFKLDQLFKVLVPELVVWFAGVRDVTFPIEPDSVQNYLSIKSNFVTCLIGPLVLNTNPKSLVLFVPQRHCAMAILSFQLDKMFMLPISYHKIPSWLPKDTLKRRIEMFRQSKKIKVLVV